MMQAQGLADCIGIAARYFSRFYVYLLAGWLNLLGQVALTASVESCLANHLSAMVVIYNGHVFTQEELLLCYAGKWCTHS